MKKIYLIAEPFLSFVGGAERSILEEIKLIKNKEKFALTFDQWYDTGNFEKNNIKVTNYGIKLNFTLSRFITFYILNINYIKRILEKNSDRILKSEYVITQGVIAPIVAAYCIKNKIPYRYYLRDNTNVHIFKSKTSLKATILKFIKTVFEFPAIYRYKKMNITALKNASEIIANSQGMADKLKLLGFTADKIIYPKIDMSSFKNAKLDKKKQVYVTFVGGGDIDKGYDTFEKVAKIMDKTKFLVVGRYKKQHSKGNLTFFPWQKDPLKIYEKSKIVIAVQRWNKEFAGRLAQESLSLKIPTITSSPVNTIRYDNKILYVLNDSKDVKEWVKAINNFIK